jgi:hypothetical protein
MRTSRLDQHLILNVPVLKRPAARLVKLKPIGAIIGSSAHFTNDRQSAAVAAAAVNRYKCLKLWFLTKEIHFS